MKNIKNMTDQKENYEKIILNLQNIATLASTHTDQNKSETRLLQEQVQKLQKTQSSNIIGELLKEQKKRI